MKFFVAEKQEMTQVYNDQGHAVPVTALRVLPAVVVRTKTEETDGYTAAVVGIRPYTKKTRKGERKAYKKMKEVRLDSLESVEAEQVVDATGFDVGDIVKVTGRSIGKGFQGVVKRHGFHGSPKSHGHKDQLRMPGSIGASSSPSKVFKGMRMGGRTGNEQKTVRGLSIVEIDADNNRVLVSGAVPGKRNGLIYVYAQ